MDTAGQMAQPITGPPPLLVSIRDAGRLLSLSRSTIYELIWDGEFTVVRIGRSVRLRYDELHDFVERRMDHAS